MIRWLSIGVLSYMVLGIIWWGLLLNRKNDEIYQLRLERAATPEVRQSWQQEKNRQRTMILGEGLVLGISLLLGIYIINRSAQKEIQIANDQNDFLLSVSHELKSPIAAIKLAFQTLKRKGLREEQKEQFLNSGVKDANRLEKLVQNLLLSANIQEKPLELYYSEIDLSDIVRNLTSRYKNEFPNYNWKLSGLNEKVMIKGDANNLKLALNNIIENAIKYVDEKEEIEIKTAIHNNRSSIVVRNSCKSLSQKEVNKIFNKFYRGQDDHSRKNEGTGLGLYIARKIIEAHQGSVIAEVENQYVQILIEIPSHGS